MSYYDRQYSRTPEGQWTFKTEEDYRNECEVAALVQDRWGCKLHSYGRFAPVDWWAERFGKVVGFLELKGRTHPVGKYPTVFLNQRKYIALTIAEKSGPPAVFIVKWLDDIRFTALSNIDPTRLAVGGCTRLMKSENDIEPVIHVPIRSMTRL
jgi:hypothetical protein